MSGIEDPVISLVVTVVAALATAMFTSLFTSWQFWRSQKAELEKEYSIKFNDKKWEVYIEFAELVRDMMDEPSSDPVDFRRRKISLASQIVLIGSDDVVSAFTVWQAMAKLHEKGHTRTEEKLFDLITSMRKDLGNKYTRLDKESLLGALNPNHQQN